jgi:SAM-dependent methyltransferase
MTMTLEMESLKTRLRSTWMSGDYGYFAKYLQPGAFEFLKRLDVAPGTKMLDVACGTGQIAIPAARAGAKVTGIDIASNLVDQAQERARAEGLDAQFDEGDAEMLPYADGSFDLVVSLIGAMFAPVPERVAAELVRVCRPGGRIVMANWTPEGHVGQMFKIMGAHFPTPLLMASPVKWGDEATVRHRLKDGIARLDVSRRLYPMRYPFPPSEVVEFFRLYYGPTNRAFSALDNVGRSSLRHDLEQLWDRNNLAGSGATYVKSEYLEVVAIRQ